MLIVALAFGCHDREPPSATVAAPPEPVETCPEGGTPTDAAPRGGECTDTGAPEGHIVDRACVLCTSLADFCRGSGLGDTCPTLSEFAALHACDPTLTELVACDDGWSHATIATGTESAEEYWFGADGQLVSIEFLLFLGAPECCDGWNSYGGTLGAVVMRACNGATPIPQTACTTP